MIGDILRQYCGKNEDYTFYFLVNESAIDAAIAGFKTGLESKNVDKVRVNLVYLAPHTENDVFDQCIAMLKELYKTDGKDKDTEQFLNHIYDDN